MRKLDITSVSSPTGGHPIVETLGAVCARQSEREAIVSRYSRCTYAEYWQHVLDASDVLTNFGRRRLAIAAWEATSTLVWLMAGLRVGCSVGVCNPRDPSAVESFGAQASVSAVAGMSFTQLAAVGCEAHKTAEHPDDVPIIGLVTAGTTGLPKVVAHTEESLGWAAAQLQLLRSEMLGASDALTATTSPEVFAATALGPPLDLTYLGGLPPWTMATLTIALQALLSGDRFVAHCDSAAGTLVSLIIEFGVTNLSLSPHSARQLVRQRDLLVGTHTSLLHVGVGGGPVPSQLMARLEDVTASPVTVGYGATEAGGPIAISRITDPADVRHTTVGRPLPRVETRIRDDVLEVRSPSLARGYLSGENVEPITGHDGWWRTSDRATERNDRNLVLLGREDDVILRGGRKIDPLRLEAALEEIRGIDRAAVIGMPSRVPGEEDVWAVVSGQEPDHVSMVEHVRSQGLTPPQRLVVLASMPTTPDGGVRRSIVRDMLLE